MQPKILLKPSTLLFPLPAVMVSCGSMQHSNIITISWTGTVCSEPPMCYISVRPERYSHKLISETMDFVINLTNASLAVETDFCGVRSGKDFNKFEVLKLTKIQASVVNSPMIAEAPVNIECKVKNVQRLGSHDMFLAEVVAVHANQSIINPKTQAVDLRMADLIVYNKGYYHGLKETYGSAGYSNKLNF
jgi:flavin reductase (DIM6/NTAB) family NADH-FMN oxidoreductase RutF